MEVHGAAAAWRGDRRASRLRGSYVRRLIVVDAVIAGTAGLIGFFVRFGAAGPSSVEHVPFAVAMLLPAVWVSSMLVARAYEQRFLWSGAEEFRRVFIAAMMLLAAVGTGSWAFKLDVARGFVVLAVPLATVLTLVARYVQRQALHRARGHGQYHQTTLLVGHRGAVAALDEQIGREAYQGYRVLGPELRGVRRLTKEAFDRSSALLGLVLLFPFLLGIAVAIVVTSRGPVFFRQERVGRDGQVFSMLKFRSMVVDADRLVDQLAPDSEGNGVLFKKKVDPRATRVGRVLRRFSVDELPQLINVIKGDMSLVGPRPPLQREVEKYGYDMHRRFLVKPGLTGLWQVSGRSDLSWDDSVRIDVRYVENWSLAFDFMILWKTVSAVLRGTGAY